MDGLGLRDELFRMAERLVENGFCVLLPNLYVRIGTQLAVTPGWTSTFLRDRGRGMRAAMVEEDGKPALPFRASQELTELLGVPDRRDR